LPWSLTSTMYCRFCQPFDAQRCTVGSQVGLTFKEWIRLAAQRQGATCRGNRSRPEGDKRIANSELWPRSAALQVPVEAAVDVTGADWRNCAARGGLADRSSSAAWFAPSGSCRPDRYSSNLQQGAVPLHRQCARDWASGTQAGRRTM